MRVVGENRDRGVGTGGGVTRGLCEGKTPM